MKHSLIFYIAFLFMLSAHAQYPVTRYHDPTLPLITLYQSLNTSDSAILLSGVSSDTMGNNKLFIAKLDTAGNILNAIYSDSTQLYGGCNTSDGGYLMAGIGGVFPQEYSCFVKTDTDLNIQWTKKRSKNSCINGETSPTFVRIGQTIYYAEQFRYCNQTYGIHLFKTDESGNLISQTVIGDSITYQIAYLILTDLYATNDNHLVLTGVFLGNNYGLAYITLDTNFTILSSTYNRIDGYPCNIPQRSVMLTDESILMTGQFRDDCSNNFVRYNYVMKFSPGGNVEFVRAVETIPRKELVLFPVQLSENKYALVGRTIDTLNADGVAISILIDSSGNYLSSHYENQPANYRLFWRPIKVIGSSLHLFGMSPKLETIFTAKTDSNVLGMCSPAPLNVSFSPVINVIDSVVQLYHSNGAVYSHNDAVIQFSPSTLAADDFCQWLTIEQTEEQENLVVFPNPTTGKVFVKNLQTKLKEVELYNLLGEKVLTINPDQNEIDISSLPPGIYILEIHSGEKLLRSKVVKE